MNIKIINIYINLNFNFLISQFIIINFNFNFLINQFLIINFILSSKEFLFNFTFII